MRFGVFDHVDLSVPSIAEHYENRLRLIEAYDRVGLHGYYIAEHHSTPLGMASSPGLFLSAVAQRTRRLRFGPMIYQLGIHHPLLLLEEIGMLDQMSGGRLDIGVGSGINPVELDFFGVDAKTIFERFDETLAIIRLGMTSPELTYKGRFYTFEKIPMIIRPLQRPHPPLWYGAHRIETAQWAAQNDINIGSHLPPAETRVVTDAFRAEWARLAKDATALPHMALTQHLVLADTDREARAVARRVYPGWHAKFYYLHRIAGRKPTFIYPESYDDLETMGDAIAGSAATVRAVLRERMAVAGTNYLFCRFAYGEQTLAETLRSLDIFAREVMPEFADAGAMAAAK